jgi:hypothetical protein
MVHGSPACILGLAVGCHRAALACGLAGALPLLLGTVLLFEVVEIGVLWCGCVRGREMCIYIRLHTNAFTHSLSTHMHR